MILPHKIFNKVTTVVSLVVLLLVIGVIQDKFEDWSQSFYHAGAYDGHGGGGCTFTSTCGGGGDFAAPHTIIVSFNGTEDSMGPTFVEGVNTMRVNWTDDQSMTSCSNLLTQATIRDRNNGNARLFSTIDGNFSNIGTSGDSSFDCQWEGEFTLGANYTATIDAYVQVEDDSANGALYDGPDVSVDTTSATPGVTIVESGGTLSMTEGSTDFYNVYLDSQPASDVTITINDDDPDVTANKETLTFTSLAWSDADFQTVTVTAVDDSIAEGAHVGTITHTASSADADYNGIAVGSATADITDNDTAGVTVSAISGNTSEAGGTGTFTVVLTSEPTGDVVIDLATSDSTEGTVSPASLTFTPSGPGIWSTPQTVTVTGVDDAIDDGDVAYTALVTMDQANTNDTTYDAIEPNDVSITNTNDDTAGVTVSAISGNTTEAGATATYTVVLTSEPLGNVEVDSVTDDATEGTVTTGGTLTFTTANWSVPQTVTVTGANDNIDDGNVAYNIVTTTDDANTNDDTYDAINPNDVSVTNEDDADAAGVTLVETDASTDVTEVTPATTDTYTLVLDSEPTANVTINLSYDTEQLNVAESSDTPNDDTLLFTTANWDTPQTITVNALDDSIDDPATVTISHTLSAANTDAKYDSDSASFTIDPVTVNVTDNDTAGATVTPTSGSTSEVGGTDTFDVELNTKPTGDVVVTVVSSDTGEGTVNKATLTFTSLNWNTPQTVTVTGADDSIDDGSVEYTITLETDNATTADDTYDAVNPDDVTMTNLDDDTAGITIGGTEAEYNISVTEGGVTDTFTVVLNTQPTANVVVNLSAANSEVTFSANSLTFTDANWNVAQEVTVTALNDSIDEDAETDTISYTVTSSPGDANYHNMDISAQNITANITDNDTAGFTITEVGGASTDVTEGSTTDTFTIALNTQPANDVTVTITTGDDVDVSSSTVTFTAADWDATTITVTATDDNIDEDAETDTISFSVASSDLNYNEFDLSGSTITANVTDNDTASISTSLTSNPAATSWTLAVTEGAVEGDQFDVVLGTAPESDVTINVSAASGLTFDDSSLLFTSANWNTTQTVTVTGTDNDVDGADTTNVEISLSISTADAKYGALANPSNITVTVTDDDTAGITVTESAGSTDVTEGSDTDTFTVVLDTQPTESVTITVASGSSDATVAPESLTFTTVNWATAQSITVTAADDDVVEDAETATITTTAASGDTKYDGVTGTAVTANITSDDTAGVTVTESAGVTSATEGATDTYTVVLTSEPANDVTVTIDGNDAFDARATLDPTTLTFTAADWDTAQTVTITATDNEIVDGEATGTISHAATSDDTNYSAIEVSDVSVTIVDNDVEEEASSSGGGGSSGVSGFSSGNSGSSTSTTTESVNVDSGELDTDVTIVNNSGVEVELDKGTEVTDETTGEQFVGEIKPPQVVSGNDAPAGAPFGNKIKTIIKLETSTGSGVRFNKPVEVCVPKPANLGDRVEIWFFNQQTNKWEFVSNDVAEEGGKLCFKTDHFSYFAVTERQLDFDLDTEFIDIDGHWAEEHIKYLEDRGIIKAGPTKEFTPNRSINRGELVSMTVNAFGLKYKETVDNVFVDLLSTSPYFKAIMAAYERGIIQGYPDGTFQEYGPALRVEALKVLLLASNKDKGCPPVNRFVDISKLAWYYPYVNCGIFHEVVQGYGDGKFLPARQVTKAEAAKMLAEIIAE